MATTLPLPGSSNQPPRSATVTALAWVVILASAALIPISFITLLMIMVGSYGTSSTSFVGFVNVVVAPPAALVAGIGLLRRKSWARHYFLVLFAVILAYNIHALWRATPETLHYVSPTGVPTTVLPTDRGMFVPIIVVCLGALSILLLRRVRLEFAAPPGLPASPHPPPTPTASRESRDWRVGHVGRDGMYYEEWRDGAWHRLDIDGEMLIGRAHHVVYFASPERWLSYPEWARHRRDEIVARIKGEFREPDYEYSDTGALPAPIVAATVPSSSRQGLGALIVAMTLLLALVAAMGWLVYTGVTTGETVLPSKLASQRRPVLRADEPISFWVSIVLYASVAIGAVGLVGWGLAQTRRDRRH